MSTPVSKGSGADRSQAAVQKFVDTALREVLSAVTARYFKAPEKLGPIANLVFSELTETASRQAGEGARRPKKADILQSAARLAAAVLLDTKGQGEIREGFHALVRAVAGDPPQVDDEKNAKLTKRKNTKDDGTLTLPKSHILWVLLDRIGLQNPKFGTNAKDTLNNPRHSRLDDKAGWQGFAIDLAEAVLKDGAELAKSLVQKLVGTDLSSAAVEPKSNGHTTPPPPVAPIPTEAIGEAEASNTARRVSADTSPMLTLVRNLASTTAATRAKRESRDPAAIGAEINAPEAIVRHVADALGVKDAKGIAVATKLIEKAFAPYQEYENPTKFDALEAVLNALIKSSEDKVKNGEEKLRRAERAYSRGASGQPDEKAKDAVDKATTELGTLKNELTTLRARLEHAQAIRDEVTEVGASESMEKAFSYLLGQGLGKLVADALELSPSDRKGMDRLDTLDKIYQGLFHKRDRMDRTGIERLEERAKERTAEGGPTPESKGFELPSSLLKIIDSNDPAGSAAAIAKAFPMLEQPEAAELKDKLVKTMTTLIEKHRPQSNLDLVGRLSQALVDTGVSNEAASILTLFATGVQSEAEAALKSAHEAAEKGKQRIEQQKGRVAAMETELVKKQSALKELKDNLPEEPARRAEAETTIKSLEQTIAEYETQLGKLKTDVVEARKALPQLLAEAKGAREDYLSQMDGIAVSGLESLLRALLDPKATEEFLLAQKPRLQEMGYLPKDDKAGAGGGNKPPKDPNGPNGPNGPNDPPPPSGPSDPGRNGSRLPHRGEPTPAQMRALECAQVLADPCLSIQDKVFYFMLIFAKWSDKEREDKLRELTKQEEEAAKWDAQRQDISKSQDARIEERRQVNKELDTAEARLRALQTKVDAGDLPPDSKELKEAQEKVKNLNERSQDLTRGVEKLGDELREAANKADKAPRARELIFSEIDKITKFRDQMINMARSMIDDANRLIERIFR